MGLGLSKRSSAIYPSKKDSSDTGLRAKKGKRRLRRGATTGNWQKQKVELFIFLFPCLSLSFILLQLSSLGLPVVVRYTAAIKNSFGSCYCMESRQVYGHRNSVRDQTGRVIPIYYSQGEQIISFHSSDDGSCSDSQIQE